MVCDGLMGRQTAGQTDGQTDGKSDIKRWVPHLKRALRTVKGHFVWQMAVANTKLPLFKDRFWHFQIKIKFRKKIMR